MPSAFINTINSRWKTSWLNDKRFHPTHAALANAISLVELVETKRPELAKPGTLSTKGLQDGVRGFFAATLVPRFAKARIALDREAAALEARRGHFHLPLPDAKDVVGAMARAEWRAMMRTMDTAKVVALVIDGQNEVAVAAAFEAPGLSNVPLNVLDRLRETILDAKFGAELAAISEEEEALEVVRATLTWGLMQMRTAGEFSEQGSDFEDFVKTNSSPIVLEAERAKPAAPVSPDLGWKPSPEVAAMLVETNAKFAATVDEIFNRAFAA